MTVLIQPEYPEYIGAADAKFISDSPLPTAHETEILTIMSEECAEINAELLEIQMMRVLSNIQKRVAKMQRFGVDEIQRDHLLSNKDRLSDEIGDLWAVVARAISLDIVSEERIADAAAAKEIKMLRYLQTET